MCFFLWNRKEMGNNDRSMSSLGTLSIYHISTGKIIFLPIHNLSPLPPTSNNSFYIVLLVFTNRLFRSLQCLSITSVKVIATCFSFYDKETQFWCQQLYQSEFNQVCRSTVHIRKKKWVRGIRISTPVREAKNVKVQKKVVIIPEDTSQP